MCRLLGYLGPSLPLDYLLYKPEHSLIVQSYKPREMISGTVNVDGFGVGWYHSQQETDPFIYKNTIPIWNDINLPYIGRYVESRCVLGYVRSATPGQALDFSNSQPFEYQRLLCIHNGRIENFQQTLYRPIRDRLSDEAYKLIKGTTDSEHLFGLIVDKYLANPTFTLEQAFLEALLTLNHLAESYQVAVSANMVVSNGHRLVASRFASGCALPSLYWLRDDPTFPEAVIIASEPLFEGNWNCFPKQSILSVGEDLDIQIHQL